MSGVAGGPPGLALGCAGWLTCISSGSCLLPGYQPGDLPLHTGLPTSPTPPTPPVSAARRAAYRTIMLSYAGVCSLWIPLLAWMMPSHSFRVGMMYLMRRDWTFEVRLRSGGFWFAGQGRGVVRSAA